MADTRTRTLVEVEEALRLAHGLTAAEGSPSAVGLCEAAEIVREMQSCVELSDRFVRDWAGDVEEQEGIRDDAALHESYSIEGGSR